MLDIRAVAYIAPLSEVDFAPVPLTVRLVNYADEPGLVSGGFRIYNGITGLLVHQSDITPLELSKGETTDVSALTDFSPPGPAVDTYFVLFDGIAANALVPDGITIHLGTFYFDVKPAPLGPIPAGHAVTHEDTGIDEINVTDLSGLLADPQTPILHHLEHEAGGADEINVAGLSGELADDQPPKAHGNAAHTSTFEDQANKGVAGGYCGLPNTLNTTLPLRADGLAARPEGLFYENDLFQPEFASESFPWQNYTLSSGVNTPIAALSNHPGVLRWTSSVTPNSGGAVRLRQESILLAGHESCDLIFRPQVLAGATIRFGFLDTITSADAVDGCYIEMTQVAGVDGTIVGKTSSNSVRSTTGTSLLLVTNTWYRLRVVVNSNATQVNFFCFDEAGNLLWTDNLTTNIPTAASRETGNGVIATNSGSSAVIITDIDYMSITIARALIR